MNKKSYPKLHSIKWKNGALAENVICVPDRARENIPASDVLKGAYERDLRDVVVFGYEQDGTEYAAGTTANIKEGAYMFARGQLMLLRLSDD